MKERQEIGKNIDQRKFLWSIDPINHIDPKPLFSQTNQIDTPRDEKILP